MTMQKIADDLEELYRNYQTRIELLHFTDYEGQHAEEMQVHLLRARIELEKCKWLETIAKKMPEPPVKTLDNRNLGY